jgi:hypothetical protein
LYFDLDRENNIIITGHTSSTNFPITSDALQLELQSSYLKDGFVSILSSDGSSLIYSSFIGGNGEDRCRGVYFKNEVIYLIGETSSTNFLIQNTVQETKNSSNDFFFLCFKIEDYLNSDETSETTNTTLNGDFLFMGLDLIGLITIKKVKYP